MRHLVRPSALVATYFDTLAPNQVATARALQQVVLGAAPQLEQTVKWGNLTFICDGAALAREFPELEGVGKGIRHLKLRYAQPLDADLIHDLVRASVALGVRREE